MNKTWFDKLDIDVFILESYKLTTSDFYGTEPCTFMVHGNSVNNSQSECIDLSNVICWLRAFPPTPDKSGFGGHVFVIFLVYPPKLWSKLFA